MRVSLPPPVRRSPVNNSAVPRRPAGRRQDICADAVTSCWQRRRRPARRPDVSCTGSEERTSLSYFLTWADAKVFWWEKNTDHFKDNLSVFSFLYRYFIDLTNKEPDNTALTKSNRDNNVHELHQVLSRQRVGSLSALNEATPWVDATFQNGAWSVQNTSPFQE